MLRPFLRARKRMLMLLIIACLFSALVTLSVYSGSSPNTILVAAVALIVVMILFWNDAVATLLGKTERAEQKLRESEELFSTIIKGINDGIFDFNLRTGEISYAASYAAILGYSIEEMGTTHERFNELMHPDDFEAAWETARLYFEHKIPVYKSVFRLRHKEGHWVWIVSRGIGVWDEQGQIQRLIGTHSDITQQKLHEDEVQTLMKANELARRELEIARDKAEDANNAKSDFLATMSHEIRTPMNAVIGLSRILLGTPLAPKQKEMLETLRVNAEILMQLVNNLLDINRIESSNTRLELAPFTVAQTLQTIQSMFHSQMTSKKLTFEVDNHCGDTSYIGDRSRIQQILVNLVSNACKFTTAGSVTLTAACHKLDDGTASVDFRVTDTGIGISEEHISSVFDKFVQADHTISRRYGGSGLGLAICKSLTTLMKGELTVTSKPNVGSTFKLVLPLTFATHHVSDDAIDIVQTTTPPSELGTALIVEDYPANILVATLMLENLGYTVDVARSGSEGIEKFKQRDRPYAVILMDVQMPDIDGYETTRRIRALEATRGFSNYIVGVTANAFAHDRALCLEAGMNDYISKPIHQDLLQKKLSEIPFIVP